MGVSLLQLVQAAARRPQLSVVDVVAHGHDHRVTDVVARGHARVGKGEVRTLVRPDVRLGRLQAEEFLPCVAAKGKRSSY